MIRKLAICFSLFALAAPVLAQERPTGKIILKELNVKESEIRELESGEVITKLGSEYEQSARELAIDATVLIRKPLSELLSESTDDTSIIPGKLILDSGVIESEADLDKISIPEDRAEEAEYWLNASPGDDLNLGPDDFEIMDRLKAERGEATDLELANRMIREVMKHRYREYMAKGLDGIGPYQRPRGKLVSAGAELKASNMTLNAVEKYFPDYYDTLVNFPSQSSCCENRFIWIMGKVRSRPTLILVHLAIYESDEAALLTERHFYISHSLNSLQITLGWLPWDEGEEGTYMGIVTSANSDFLTGFVGKVIRVLGANKGAEMVGDVLVEIRDDIEAGVDPSEQYEE